MSSLSARCGVTSTCGAWLPDRLSSCTGRNRWSKIRPCARLPSPCVADGRLWLSGKARAIGFVAASTSMRKRPTGSKPPSARSRRRRVRDQDGSSSGGAITWSWHCYGQAPRVMTLTVPQRGCGTMSTCADWQSVNRLTSSFRHRTERLSWRQSPSPIAGAMRTCAAMRSASSARWPTWQRRSPRRLRLRSSQQVQRRPVRPTSSPASAIAWLPGGSAAAWTRPSSAVTRWACTSSEPGCRSPRFAAPFAHSPGKSGRRPLSPASVFHTAWRAAR